MMRLLDKKSVSVQVAIEKKRQIDAGVALASKVDALRETKLKEEAQLEAFRKQTIAQTQAEIDSKVKEKDLIVAQIKARKEELVELQKPLEARWKKLEAKEEELNEEHTYLLRQKATLEQGIALNIQRERLNEQEKQRVATERQTVTKLLTEADLMREMSAGILTNAKTKADEVTTNAQRRDETSSKREKAMEIRERDVAAESARLKKIEKEQARKDKEIKDKYETLLRDIKRHDNSKRQR